MQPRELLAIAELVFERLRLRDAASVQVFPDRCLKAIKSAAAT
jgi:hypothetical protein